MYELSRDRFKELKHFCLQYREYREAVREAELGLYANHDDPVSRNAIKIRDNLYAIDLIERTAMDTNRGYADALLRSVTEDISFNRLRLTINKGEFDDLRNKFFYLLSERKGI